VAYVRHQTLTISTVALFTGTAADNASSFEIVNRNGAGEVYVSYTGSNAAGTPDPTVGGNDFDVVPAVTGATLRMRRIGTGNIVVKLISSAATAVTVRALA
jgi:hypothetical protein